MRAASQLSLDQGFAMRRFILFAALLLAAPAWAAEPLASPAKIEQLRTRYAAGDPYIAFVVAFDEMDPSWQVPPGFAYIKWLVLEPEKWEESYRAKYLNIARDSLINLRDHPTDRNDSRQFGWWNPAFYAQLKDTFSADERAIIEAKLKQWAEDCLRVTRLGDTDEVLGHYGCLVLTDDVLGTNYLSREASGETTYVARQMKAEIEGMMRRAKGGLWLAGTDYNTNDMQILAMLCTLLGPDHFEGGYDFLRDVARHKVRSMRPGLNYGEKGPDSQSREFGLYELALSCILSGLLKDEPEAIELRKYIREITDLGPGIYHQRFTLDWMLLSTFDPATILPSGSRPTRNGLHLFEGQGQIIEQRDGGLFFQVNAQNNRPGMRYIDHSTHLWGFRFHDGKEWLYDRPLGYVEFAGNYNTTLVGGYGPQEYRQLVSHEETPRGCRAVMATQGGTVRVWIDEVERDGQSVRVTTQIDATGGIEHIRHAMVETQPEAIEGGYTWLSEGGQRVWCLSSGRGTIEKTESWVNVGSWMDPREARGWLLRFKTDGGPWLEQTTTLSVGEKPAVPTAQKLTVAPVSPLPALPDLPDVPDDPDVPPADPLLNDKPKLAGEWVSFAGGYGGNLDYAGPGPNVATWEFKTQPGTFKVFAVWPPHPNRARNAKYTVGDKTVRVNQESDPGEWYLLETVTAGETLTVVLDAADADEFVIADAVRIERIGDASPTEIKVQGVIRGKQLIIELP